MNILFLYSSPINPTKGGVQRVTNVLGNYLENKSHQIFYLGLKKTDDDYSDNRQYYVPDGIKFNTLDNVKFFNDFLIENSIDVIINQGAIGKDISDFVFKVKNIPIISVIHNSLLSSIQNFTISKQDVFRRYKLESLLPFFNIFIVKKMLLYIYKLKYQKHIDRLCNNSSKVVLLSEKFKSEIGFFIKNSNFLKNIISIANPCSFTEAYEYDLSHKEKILLFVGRVDFSQKKVDILLNIWEKIFNEFQDWKLVIVGDGPDMEKAQNQAKKIKNVFFEGFNNPNSYYKKSTIFCMTSSFEGFPMTLPEAMYYGVIPVVFNSFLSVSDIIDDDLNGKIVDSFDINQYADILSKLMSDDEKRNRMAKEAIIKSKSYSLDLIGNVWNELLVNEHINGL